MWYDDTTINSVLNFAPWAVAARSPEGSGCGRLLLDATSFVLAPTLHWRIACSNVSAGLGAGVRGLWYKSFPALRESMASRTGEPATNSAGRERAFPTKIPVPHFNTRRIINFNF
jgi:hypothetical protein